MENKLAWIDNPYRTIIEHAELQIMKGGTTVKGAIEDLEQMLEKTDNEVAKERVSYVLNHLEDSYDARYLRTKNYLLQGMIIQYLKQNLI